jgi:hypothetical protein
MTIGLGPELCTHLAEMTAQNATFKGFFVIQQYGAGWWRLPRWRLATFIVVDPDALSGVRELVIEHGDGGRPREPWIGAIEPERQTF